MDKTLSRLLDQLINKAFDNIEDQERLAFIERLFSELPAKSQQAVIQGLIRNPSTLSVKDVPQTPRVISLEINDDQIQDIGPWRMCCEMMIDIDRTDTIDLLDTAKPTRLFNALGDATRIKIIKLLSQGELSVDSIAKELDAPQPTVSHHLKILRELSW